MFCPKCGKENSDYAQFCTGCGSDLSPINQTPQPSQQSYQAQTQHEQPKSQQESTFQSNTQQYDSEPTLQQDYHHSPVESPDVTNKPKSYKKLIIIGAIICVVLVVSGIVGQLSGSSSSGNGNSSVASAKMTDNVIKAAQSAVYKLLKTPSTSTFGATKILEKDNYNRFLVCVTVDAQNAFGAYIRNTFVVIVYDVTAETYRYNSSFGIQSIDGFNPDNYTTDAEKQPSNEWSAYSTIEIMKKYCGWGEPFPEDKSAN